MTEFLKSTPEHEGTRFEAETVIDMHAAREDLSDLEAARIAWRQAEMEREQARKAAEEAATYEARRTEAIGSRVTWYRGESLRSSNPDDYGLVA